MLTIIHKKVTPVNRESNQSYINLIYNGYMSFTKWLDQELEKRNWSRSRLSKEAGFSHVALSHIYAGNRQPGIELCTKIAVAFGLPPETVIRHAGLLPATVDNIPNLEELKYYFSKMTPDEREEFLQQGRLKIELRERREKGKGNNKPSELRT